MEHLQELIAKRLGLNAQEIRAIRFKYPQKGLIQAIRQVQGDESAEKLLQGIADDCKLEIIAGEKIQIDRQLIQLCGNEISRLGFAFKAVPLKVVDAAQGKVVQLAMADPTDAVARESFARLFSVAVQPMLAREEELLEALRFQIPSGTRGTRVLRPNEQFEGEGDTVRDGLKTYLSQLIEGKARELVFELLGNNVVAQLKQTRDRSVPLETLMSADELMAAILRRAQLLSHEAEAMKGVAHFHMLPAGVDFHFEFIPEHKSQNGEKGRLLVISEVEVKEPLEPVFWESPSKQALEKLKAKFEEAPGLYLLAIPDSNQQVYALSALQRRYPDVHVIKEIAELSSDPDNKRRLQYAKVILPLKSQGIGHLLKLLEKAPPALKELIRGLGSYVQLPRPCAFCREDIPASKETLSLLPEALHSRLQRLHYSRGCPLCAEQGYIGSTTIVNFVPVDANISAALQSGSSTQELLSVLRKSGWTPIAEIALEQALRGMVTVEQIVATLLGGSPQKPKPRAGDFVPELTPLAESRVKRNDSKPQNQVEFHSVVLQAGDDLMAARQALLAEQSAGEVLGAHSQPNPEKPKTSDSGHAFHSVVLDLDDDMASMRAKLLAEMDDD